MSEVKQVPVRQDHDAPPLAGEGMKWIGLFLLCIALLFAGWALT